MWQGSHKHIYVKSVSLTSQSIAKTSEHVYLLWGDRVCTAVSLAYPCRKNPGLLQLHAKLQLDNDERDHLPLPGRLHPGRYQCPSMVPGCGEVLLPASSQEA